MAAVLEDDRDPAMTRRPHADMQRRVGPQFRPDGQSAAPPGSSVVGCKGQVARCSVRTKSGRHALSFAVGRIWRWRVHVVEMSSWVTDAINECTQQESFRLSDSIQAPPLRDGREVW